MSEESGSTLQSVDAHDSEPLVQQVVGECVAGRSHSDDKNILAIVAKRNRALHIQRIPARQQRVNLEAVRKVQDIGQDAGFNLRDVDRRLFLKDAGFHAVIADPMPGPGAERVVDHHRGERADYVASAFEKMSFRYLFIEGATIQTDPQRILLNLALFLVAPGAGVF